MSRAIDVALDHMPRDHWSDFPSANAFLDMVAEFNESGTCLQRGVVGLQRWTWLIAFITFPALKHL